MSALAVTALSVHPVKSLAGVALSASPVDARGLTGDRRWGVVSPDGTAVTARELHGLLGLTALPTQDESIVIEDRTGGRITVAPPRDAAPIAVTHSDQGVRPCGSDVTRWLSARLGRELMLVWQGDDVDRPIRSDRGGRDGDRNSLADAAPILLTTDSSLARLNSWLAESGVPPIGHDRFRPNIVLDGAEPFAEDDWRSVTIGSVSFRTTMVCDRCVMTTIDRVSLETSKEPIRTLARQRAWGGATWFGIRLTPALPVPPDAAVRVGDPVSVTSS